MVEFVGDVPRRAADESTEIAPGRPQNDWGTNQVGVRIDITALRPEPTASITTVAGRVSGADDEHHVACHVARVAMLRSV